MKDWCSDCKNVVTKKSKIFKETGLCDECYKKSNPVQLVENKRETIDQRTAQVELFN